MPRQAYKRSVQASARAAGRFFKTPKGLLLVGLIVLLAPVLATGAAPGAPAALAVAVAAALVVDIPILWVRQRRPVFPSGALLTGLLVAMVLSAREPWYMIATAGALGIAAKYAFRSRTANLLNPAAVGIVAATYVFTTGESWWGAAGLAGWLSPALLFAVGIFIVLRVNKLPLVLAFLGGYFLLFTAAAYLGQAANVAEIFRPPDVQAALFFAFFILTDPPTSPARYASQCACGFLVAAVAFVVFQWANTDCYLLIAVLAGNGYEAWRRSAGATHRWRFRPARTA